MDWTNYSRKRKRPSYLNDFFANGRKKTPASKKNGGECNESGESCSLCSEVTESSGQSLDMKATTGESKYTFSSALSTRFKEDGLNTDNQVQELSEGSLCEMCGGSLSNLDRFQHKVKGVESSIIIILKRSKPI